MLMNIKLIGQIVFTVILILFGITACNEKEGTNRCTCINDNGDTVVDTVYIMQYDQAYQLCEAKEGTQNIWKCTCTEE